MKVLMINGSPHERGCTHTALAEVAKTLADEGVGHEMLWIGDEPVAGCIACMKCRKSGRCVYDDAVNEILAMAEHIDALVVGSPVYYASASGQVCSLMDRLFYAGSAKFAHKPAAAVVSCRRGGAASAFDRLNKYFTINSMPVVSSQYWNMVFGREPGEARRDAEGLQTMRLLGRNMAWLLRCLEEGKKRAPAPEPGARVRTNFIR